MSDHILAVLGGLVVEPTVTLPPSARRLAAFLAVREAPIERSIAAGMLWPDRPVDQARSQLRRAVFHLPRPWLRHDHDMVELSVTVDLRAARAVARRALGGDVLAQHELDLLGADLLPGWGEEWVLPAQAEFHQYRVRALEHACRTLVARGRPLLATHAGSLAVAAEPLRESAVGALVDAYLAEGNRYDAICAYRALESDLRRELGVRPDPALARRLAAAGVAPSRRSDATGTLSERRGNGSRPRR